MKHFLAISLFAFCLPLLSQTPVYDELTFEGDSMTSAYKPSGKNYAFIRSKRGTGGVAKTSRADSILTFPITDIVLVFSELNSSAINNREEANKERWENLLKTYPELFQFSTSYKNLCQCNTRGDSAAFKQSQGFYIYFTGEEPKKPVTSVKTEEKTATEEKKSPNVAVEKNEKKKDARVKERDEPVKEKEKVKEKETVKESPVKETEKETEASAEGPETTTTISDADMTAKKKSGYTKPRRAKNPKACAPPCYENGDDDLNNFFRDNITLNKKQKRHAKQLVSMVKLQLNFDGSIKKAMITGTNEVLNQQVTGAIKSMNLWNPAVKAGVTVKSEVKFTLKFDKESKGLKANDMVINPRPNPKCKCMSESELAE